MDRNDLAVTAEINLYYDVFLPEGMSEPAPLLIAVHGYGAHKRYMMREAKLVAPSDFVIASIEAPHPHYRQTDDGYRIGYGWQSDRRSEEHIKLHHKFVNDVIDALDSDGFIDRSRIYIYGFSQACALNFRYAFTFPDVLRGFIGVCGGIPGDLDTNEKYQNFSADTLYLYGNDDEFYTNDKFVEFDGKLKGRLANYRSKQYEAGHEITQDMRGDIRDFLHQTR